MSIMTMMMSQGLDKNFVRCQYFDDWKKDLVVVDCNFESSRISHLFE